MPYKMYYEALQRQKEKYEFKEEPFEHYSSTQVTSFTIEPFKIDAEKPLAYLDIAIEQSVLCVTPHTFYISDLSQNKETPYNCILFQTKGVPLKTTETTTKVMNRFFSSRGIRYSWLQHYGRSIGIGQKCPGVIGSYYFVPDKGTSKKHASWIGMQYVLQALPLANKKTLLSISEYHELVVSLSIKSVEHSISQVHSIKSSQDRMIGQWIDLLQETLEDVPKNNVVQQYGWKNQHSKINSSIVSWTSELIYSQSLLLLRSLFKEGDHHLDLLNEKFPPDEDE